MATGKIDRFVNRAFATVTMSAANTLTFQQIRFAVGIFQGIGLLLHRISIWPATASLQAMVAATDAMTIGLTLRDDLADLDPTNQAVIVNQRWVGTATPVALATPPRIEDWSNLPGGGYLLPANPLYLGMATGGFAAAGVAHVRLDYTFLALTDKESVELLQTVIPGNV